MKKLLSFMIIVSLGMSSYSFAMDEGIADQYMQKQIEECSKNTAKEWNSELNRCVGKAEARATRNEAKECNAIVDLEQRKACHLQLASSNTGVDSDPNKVGEKVSSLQSQSTIINTASTIVSAINYLGKDGEESNCMSKTILGITSLGGFLTDIYLKIKTKKQLNELQGKFLVDAKDQAYNTQVKALIYLKEEQETVKEIASLEKKRQMLLMLGYGAAAVTAGYEMMYTPNCGIGNKKPAPNDKVVKENAPAPAQAAQTAPAQAAPAPAQAAPAAPGAPKAPETQISTQDLNFDNEYYAPATAAAPAAYEKHNQLDSIKDGNVYRTVIKDSNGTITGVVHNGEFYPNVKALPNGQALAIGKPSGKFDYNNGTWPGGKVNETALTTGYSYESGKPIAGLGGTTNISNTSFGTNKISTPIKVPNPGKR